MMKAISAFMALLFTADAAMAQPSASVSSDLQTIESEVSKAEWGKYMAVGCQPKALTGWEGFPTQQCSYESKFGFVPVILLDPDSKRMAGWLLAACRAVAPGEVVSCAEKVALRAKCQSGAQFAVAGFVDEGPLLTFRHGITVVIDGVFVDKDGVSRTYENRAPTANEIGKVMGDGVVTGVRKYARIVGTDRGEFARFVKRPETDFSDSVWQATIRSEYQKAWSSESNRLITAWAVANAAQLKKSVPFANFFETHCEKGTSWNRWPANTQ